jgi:hypothetical protein
MSDTFCTCGFHDNKLPLDIDSIHGLRVWCEELARQIEQHKQNLREARKFHQERLDALQAEMDALRKEKES